MRRVIANVILRVLLSLCILFPSNVAWALAPSSRTKEMEARMKRIAQFSVGNEKLNPQAVAKSLLAPPSSFEQEDKEEAAPSEIEPHKGRGSKIREHLAAPLIYALLGINKLELVSSYLVLVFVLGGTATAAFVPFGWAGVFTGIFGIGALIAWDLWIFQENPFRGLKPGKERVLGPMRFGVVKDMAGNVWHYAKPLDQRDPDRLVVLGHGRLYELFSGLGYKFMDHLLAATRPDFDTRYHWGKKNILGRWIVGTYLRPGKRIEDLPTFLSAAHESLLQWPFRAVDQFKKQQKESAFASLHESIRTGKLPPLPSTSRMTQVGLSAGARAMLFQNVLDYLEYDKSKGAWSIRKDAVPNVPGLILINTLFHWGKASSGWMRLQKRWFWTALKRFMRVEKSAYDEMDPESDLTKMQDRARLAAAHPKWPATVFINTRMVHAALKPLDWSLIGRRPKDFWNTLVAKWRGYGKTKKNIPLYYWLASIFLPGIDVRGEDGAVDSVEAIGLDHHGVPVIPNAISIIIEDLAHECLDNSLVQHHCAQLEDLMNDRVDLRLVRLKVTSPDGHLRRISLAGRGPLAPVILHAEDQVELLIMKAGKAKVLKESKLPYLLKEEMLGEKASREVLQATLPREPFPLGDWEAKRGESLKALELFKSILVREAWELLSEKERLEEVPKPAQTEKSENLEDLVEDGALVSDVMLQVWLAKGYLSQEARDKSCPKKMGPYAWNELLDYVVELTQERANPHWVEQDIKRNELLYCYLADKGFHRGSRALARRVKGAEYFREILLKLNLRLPKLWNEFASSVGVRARVGSRAKGILRWFDQNKEQVRSVFRYLRFTEEKSLEKPWEQFQAGKISSESFYQLLQEERPQRLLQLLLFLDLRLTLQSPYGKPAKAREPRVTLIEAAA